MWPAAGPEVYFEDQLRWYPLAIGSSVALPRGQPFAFRLRAGSQPCHAFAEPGGNRRTQEDTKKAQLEYRRTLEDTRGYSNGHTDAPVRDREAPGSNPGPRPPSCIRIRPLWGPLAPLPVLGGVTGGHGALRRPLQPRPRYARLRGRLGIKERANLAHCRRAHPRSHMGIRPRSGWLLKGSRAGVRLPPGASVQPRRAGSACEVGVVSSA